MHGDTTIDDQGTVAGISRRDMLRKSAVVGGAGALMWAAPSITAFGPRAFGQEGTPVPGEISWVMVWFQCGEYYHLVKYSGGASGYSEKCDATKQNISANDVNCENYFDIQQEKVSGTRNWDCPEGVVASTNSAGDLVISTEGSDCSIVGWVLHDGSCQNIDGAHSHPFCRSPENPLKGDGSGDEVGPTALPTNGGEFDWTTCD